MSVSRYRALALVAGLALAAPALATNGYIPLGHSAKERGMGGATTALALDSIVAATNPAGIAFTGDRIDIGTEVFSPRREYTVSGQPSGPTGPTEVPGVHFPLQPGTVQSRRNYFAVPNFGWSHRVDARDSVALTVYGHGGMNTSYPGFASSTCPPGSPGGTFCAGPTGVDLSQLFITPTWARRFGSGGRWAVGIAPILAYQRFEAKGVGSFAGFSSDPQHLSDNGHDSSWGWGGRIGVQGALTPSLRLGASWRSRVHMGRFHDYSGLFARHGGFDIPPSANIGLAWDATHTLVLAGEVQRIWYSHIRSVGNPLLPNLKQSKLGDPDGAGFGWRDMTVYKAGLQWQAGRDWIWRAGVDRTTQPIPRSEVLFNILAPGVQEWHYTAGFTRRFEGVGELSISAMYSPQKTVRGVNPLDTNQTIALKMHQYALTLDWAWTF